MQTARRFFQNHPLRSALRSAAALFLLTLLPAGLWAQAAKISPVDPLPQDTGAAGLTQTLRRLQTTARLLQIDAHPDDEDGGMLTLESRGKGATVTLLTLNRGEGGQNKLGSNLFDVLGVLRTLEVLAADRYYGVDQRFTRVADFGYSKNPEETFQKWQGHDIALADIVRVIRTFRPDVLVARFSGTDHDGHGHHQASAILTREAFRAAADPNRFPEQIKEGLLPWQAKKLYIGNVCGFGAMNCADENYTVKLNTGAVDPALGMSYAQFAMAGLKHQLSQGAGAWSVEPGDRFAFYKLVDSVPPSGTKSGGHEKDFFDGIDTSLPGLAVQLGDEEKKVPWLRPELAKIADQITKARAYSDGDPSRAAMPLSAVRNSLGQLIVFSGKIDRSDLSAAAKAELKQRLTEKFEQAETGMNLALNVTLEATVVALAAPKPGLPREADALTVVSPGQKFGVRVTLHNGSKYPLQAGAIALDGANRWQEQQKETCTSFLPGKDYVVFFAPKLPADFPATRPYWHRDNPEEDSLNTIDDAGYSGLPFSPPPLVATAGYSIPQGKAASAPCASSDRVESQVDAEVLVPFVSDKGEQQKRVLAVAPEFSVMLDPGEQVIATQNISATTVKVAVTANLAGKIKGDLHLVVPSGWRVEPLSIAVEFHARGEEHSFEFKITPSSLQEGRAQIRAVLDAGGQKYTEGYSLVTREDIGSFYYYQPATQRISIVDVKVPKDLKVAYIMGAGDNIPAVLRQIGMDVTEIPAGKLATEDLNKYGTIVLGIRAYDTQQDVATNNKKLLDFVSNGGTLVVQYNAGTGDFNSGNFTPYAARLSRARVSVEEAPVDILAPDDSVFHSPNQISQRDFEGWVQERGLYFMDSWDSHFTPLLASHDPGESPQKGGMLRVQYGRGTYIYTGYAFFRQLPAGVPGAIRLYVNLLSAGH
jgi:LmbE family N-acetylglucosaminyl deacetylase